MEVTKKIISHSRANPEKIAVVYKNVAYSYKQLAKDIEDMSKEIEKLEMGEEMPIAICMPNCIEFIICLCAAELNKHCALLLSSKFKESELSYHFNAAGIQYAFTEETSNIKLETHGFYVIRKVNKTIIWKRSHVTVPKYYSDDYICQITSGTFGAAKGVIRTIQGVKNEILEVAEAAKITGDDIFLVTPPICHSFGLIPGTLMPLYYGATVILSDMMTPADLIQTMFVHKVTVFFAVPFLYQLLSELDIKKPTLPTLRLCISAGAIMPPKTMEQFYRFSGVYVTEDYGSTETGVMCLNSDPQKYRTSVGKPLGQRQFQILTEEGEPVSDNQVGLLITKSQNDLSRYLYPIECNHQIKDGWFHIGDLGSRDEDGRIYIHGRQNNFINVAGMKVDPKEVEQAILEIEGIKEVVIVGEISERYGEIVKASIVASPSINKAIIMNHCKKRIAEYKLPKKIEFLEMIPRSETGKILYKYLRGDQEWK